MATNDRKYPGKILTTLFATSGGKQARCYTLGPWNNKGKSGDSYQDLINAIEEAGPGCKLVVKEAPNGFRPDSKGNPPKYVLEIYNAAELAEERERMRATEGDDAL